MSKPITLRLVPNSTASGNPTYPSPTTAIDESVYCISYPHKLINSFQAKLGTLKHSITGDASFVHHSNAPTIYFEQILH